MMFAVFTMLSDVITKLNLNQFRHEARFNYFKLI